MKKMKNDVLIGVCLALFSMFLLFTYIGRDKILDYIDGIHKTDTIYKTQIDTLWKDTTITKTQLVPKYIYKTKVDTVYDVNQNPIELVTENKVYNDTIVCEKDTAELQIFTSGIKSSVDSISLSLRKSEIIKTNTVEITKYIEKKKRFYISPQVGVGYGLINKNFDAYVGVGIGFNI